MELMTFSNKLMKARKYEAAMCGTIPAEQRPVYHTSTPIGWSNDPNGFSYFGGKCHLFYQYHPYSIVWGPMHWGHFTTTDFINWKMEPCALAPDSRYDKDGCFSGTAVEHDGKHILMYTGVREDRLSNGKLKLRQMQCIAVGDGVNYNKYKNNPVITGDMLPKGSSIADFRDPKIWKDEAGFWAIVGSKNEDTSGQLALFSSPDAFNWKFEKIIDFCRNEYGKMWECPDFFELDGKQILFISPQFMEGKGLEFQRGNHTYYFVGSYDKEKLEWTRTVPHVMDYGLDFYAAQTVKTPDGRRIMIAWMQNWDAYMTPEDFEWSGMMTIPRELSVRDGRIIQTPVRELDGFRKNKVEYRSLDIGPSDERIKLDGIAGRCIDLNITLNKSNGTKFTIFLAADDRHETRLTCDHKKGLITIDRSKSGMIHDYVSERTMDYDNSKDELKLRLLIDRYSIELFVNSGERAMTTLIYTPQSADGIYFASNAEVNIDIEKYDIEVKNNN